MLLIVFAGVDGGVCMDERMDEYNNKMKRKMHAHMLLHYINLQHKRTQIL